MTGTNSTPAAGSIHDALQQELSSREGDEPAPERFNPDGPDHHGAWSDNPTRRTPHAVIPVTGPVQEAESGDGVVAAPIHDANATLPLDLSPTKIADLVAAGALSSTDALKRVTSRGKGHGKP